MIIVYIVIIFFQTQAADEPRPTTSQDLAGFWDLVYIQVENCESNFSDITALRENNWVPKPKVDTEVSVFVSGFDGC